MTVVTTPTAATPPGPGAVSTPRRSVRQLLVDQPIIVLALVFAVLYLGTAIFQDSSLLTANGVRSVLVLAAMIPSGAAAQTVAMLTAGIDLSVVMTANLAAYVVANQSGAGTGTAIVLGLLVGVAVGAVNGIGIGVFNVNPLIMTLGMASILLGIVTIGLVGNGFLSGSTRLPSLVTGLASRENTIAGFIPLNFLVWAAVALLVLFVLARTGLGRTIYAVGDNPLACRLAGVRVWQVLLAVYVIAGLLAALAGILFSGTTGSVGPDATNSYLLPSVAAAVIGGTSILGGVGGYGGTIFGALILTVLNRLLLQLDIGEAYRQIVYGLIVLVLAWVYVRLTGQKGT
jgi:ribose transport system permease protein